MAPPGVPALGRAGLGGGCDPLPKMSTRIETPFACRLRLLRETPNVVNASRLVREFGHGAMAPAVLGSTTVDYLLRMSAHALYFIDDIAPAARG